VNKKKILIIDDERDMHVLVENLLETDKYEFESAFDGVEGFDKIAASQPDLVILDVQMPKMDGFEMFKKLLAENKVPGLPVIFLTGISEKRGAHFQEEDVKNHFNNKLVSYLEKPLDPDKFVKLVESKL
jgi:CheY-like chemotaxis protein